MEAQSSARRQRSGLTIVVDEENNFSDLELFVRLVSTATSRCGWHLFEHCLGPRVIGSLAR